MEVTSFDFNSVRSDVIDHKKLVAESRETKLHTISPSQITKCIREQYFNTLMKEDISNDLQVIFDHGNLIHDDYVHPILQYWLKNIIEDENTFMINEARIQFNIGEMKWDDGDLIDKVLFKNKNDPIPQHDTVSAYVDNLIIQRVKDDNITGFKELFTPIEIKSINQTAYNKLRKPKFDHTVQVALYMYCLDSEYGIITYVEKCSHNSKTYIFYKNKYEFKKLESKFKKIYLNVDQIAKKFINRGKSLNIFKRNYKIPPAEMRISKTSDFYKTINVLGSKEDYKKEFGDECTGFYNNGNVRCNFRDECMTIGIKGD